MQATAGKEKGQLPENLENAISHFRKARPGHCIAEFDHILIPSTEGSEFYANGEFMKVKGSAMRAEDQIIANLEIDGINELRTMVKSPAGETIVILESRVKPNKVHAKSLEKCGVDPKSAESVDIIFAIKLTPKS